MMNEQQLEDLCIGWFQETGWQFLHGPDIAPDTTSPERADYRQVLLRDRLLGALARINPHIPTAALEQAAHIVQTISEPQAVVRNRSFHRLLLSGVAVEFSVGDDKKTDLVHLIDFANPQHNEFLVINQFTVTGTKQPRRPDLVAFINGLPLAVIELKNPANEQTDVWDAFNQLQTYKDEIGDLFNINEALVVSDGWTARVGSLTANAERMLPWRTIANEDDRPRLQLELETVVRGFFAPELFLDYIRHFVLFEQDGDAVIKKIAGYHQFHAVREAVRATVIAASSPDKGLLEVREERATYGKEVKAGSRKAGVVWHTQGSGKSITMACYAGKLLQQPEMKNPTLVVVTDRNDLVGQLFATFCAAGDLLKTTPLQAGSRDELREMLASRQAGGIIFTTVQKFALLDEEDEH
ncbi:MAG: type I restriction endonuclease, partial [Rhodoferax sp.]|nr:type I restriction endonuclease [Rhodoferax sp.]